VCKIVGGSVGNYPPGRALDQNSSRRLRCPDVGGSVIPRRPHRSCHAVLLATTCFTFASRFDEALSTRATWSIGPSVSKIFIWKPGLRWSGTMLRKPFLTRELAIMGVAKRWQEARMTAISAHHRSATTHHLAESSWTGGSSPASSQRQLEYRANVPDRRKRHADLPHAVMLIYEGLPASQLAARK